MSQHVLRSWERRYGAIQPKRSADGTRGYDDADVRKLKLLKRATESGYPIGRIATLSAEELVELLRDSPPAVDGREKPATEREIDEILAAVRAMNGARVNDLLVRSLVTRGTDSFVMNLVPPLLERTGDLWQDKSICPAHEHLLSASLQRLLGWTMGQLSASGNAPALIAVTPTGQRHEMGALMCAILAASHGWRVEYLGPDLPAADIARAVASTGARVVALSVVHRTSGDALLSEIRSLRDELPSNVSILTGGREANRHRDKIAQTGAIPIDSLEGFRDYIAEVATLA